MTRVIPFKSLAIDGVASEEVGDVSANSFRKDELATWVVTDEVTNVDDLAFDQDPLGAAVDVKLELCRRDSVC